VLVAGCLIALLGGCGLLGGDAPTGDGSSAAAGGAEGDSWVVVERGTVTPSATPASAARPTATPAFSFAPLSTASVPPSVDGDCGTVKQTSPLSSLDVEPGAGTAVVTWFRDNNPSTVEYRLTAIPQAIGSGQQPDLEWVSVAPGAGCRTVTATVNGLDRSAPYVFSLDAVSTNYNADGNRTATIARSQVVYTS
jgi:hypothetical protein